MIADNSENSKRIAINTLLLYFRMIVTMVVGLFTSRVVLDSLGVEDYGIYNVVGGFVSMFSIVRSGLVSSTQRFITFDLGKGDKERLNKTFSTIVLIYVVLCGLVIVIAEGFGVWFIESKLTIPAERLYAAKWTFHLSLLSLIIGLLSSPYNALIIAHERMKAFAYITIYEVIAQLGVAYAIYVSPWDKLIVYSILLCIIQSTLPLLYRIYCKRNFVESNVHWHLDGAKIKEIYAFAGWSMLGGFAYMGFTQGLNMLLGVFFNPVVNAARGVAVQVQGVILRFVSNFQMAVDPQIIKSYAIGDINYMSKLISVSSRMSYYLLFLLSLPLMFETEYVMDLWLIDVPDYTELFFRLIIITTMYDAISNPYGKAIQATGRVKYYQLITSTILVLIVPVAYIWLKLGGAPYTVFVVHIILGFIAMCTRIYMAKKIVGITVVTFFIDIMCPIIKVTLASLPIPFVLYHTMNDNLARLFVLGSTSMLSVVLSVYGFGILKSEKKIVVNKIKSYRK